MGTRLDSVPPELDTPEVREDLAAYQRAIRYATDHIEVLREQHPDQWVGVWVDATGKHTVVFGSSPDAVSDEALRRSLPLKRSYIRCLAPEPRFFV